jgi:hypothetical protein
MTRTDWLKALVSLERPLDDILSPLNAHGWDSDVALVTVCRQHLLRVLDKYLNGHLMEEDVETLRDGLIVFMCVRMWAMKMDLKN